MGFLNWDKFDDKMRDRATEELLRFMALFITSAAFVCFAANLVKGEKGDMTVPLVLLTFMLATFFAWQYKRRKNEKRWGKAVRTGREVFRIGMSQPTKEERMTSQPEQEKKQRKKEE